MLHKAWNNKGEMPYCFPRSSIKFQGHTGQNITNFDPNWAFPDYRPVAAFKSLRFALFACNSNSMENSPFVIQLLAIRLQQIFAYVTTAQLLCHAQNFVAITVLESRWKWNEITIEFELRWKNISETGSRPMLGRETVGCITAASKQVGIADCH